MGFWSGLKNAVSGIASVPGKIVSGVLGIPSGGGAAYQAQSAPLMNPFTQTDQQNAAEQARSGIGQQQDFVNALQAQNGLRNQSSVLGQQQGLAHMLGAQSLGYGPNPALEQLRRTTGQNISQQAALAAGQRGSNANVGLMARQIGQQGAGIQQNAVGQAAVLRAQQQLQAEQQLQQQQAQMAGLTTQQVGQQAQGLQNLNTFGQTEQQALLNALAQYNNANVANTASQNAGNAAVAAKTSQNQAGGIGGLVGGLGQVAGGMFGVPSMSSLGGSIGGALGIGGGSAAAGGAAEVAGDLLPLAIANKGGMVPKYADGGQVGGPSSIAGRMLMGLAEGGMIQGENLAAQGEAVPGVAQVSGDSPKNDNVPALLSPGEVVIPRTVMQSKNPVENSAKFVQAILAKKRMKRK